MPNEKYRVLDLFWVRLKVRHYANLSRPGDDFLSLYMMKETLSLNLNLLEKPLHRI